jgi:ABC-type branched-subunit amino acid transport system substrate-binding protein
MSMAPTHREIVKDVGDGWAVVWDATDVPQEVRSTFESALEEQRAENAATTDPAAEETVGHRGADS